MRVIVIGGGLLGVSSAFFLNRAGCEVTLVERREACGLETSFANGGLLTPSMSDPWNAPGVLWKLLRWIGREDSPFLLRPRALPSMIGWGIGFLRNSRRAQFRDNTLRNLRLARSNAQLLAALRAELQLDYDADTRGTLKIFRDGGSMQEGSDIRELLARHGVETRELDTAGVVELEPALAPVAQSIAGGHYFPGDETGDALHFTRALLKSARSEGVAWMGNTEVTGIAAAGGRVRLAAGRDSLDCDGCVVAAGSYSRQLARSVGLRIPLRPVKGYSITLRPGDWAGPRFAVIDESVHACVTPLGARLRVAGTAEFAGYDTRVTPGRIDNLSRLVRHIYPECPETPGADIEAWTGLRPVCMDGVPLIGATRVSGVFLNTGHGHLGWTLALASGRHLANIMTDRDPELAVGDYAPARFGL